MLGSGGRGVRLGRVALGAVAAGAVAGAGWRTGALTPGGAAAAVAVGTPVFATGGLHWASVLFGFFTLSSALSRVGGARKAAGADVAAKGGRRDEGQVLANGGVAAVAALAAAAAGGEAAFPAFLGAVAAAASDTWATEVGMLSRRPPRSIVTLRPVPPGISGGVTPLGLAAAAAGGAAMGLIAALGGGEGSGGSRAGVVALATVAGLSGSLVDSLLGGTVQRVFRCPCCGVETERQVHGCGATTVPVRGVGWIDNDVVNLVGTAAGAATALVMAR
ncbi:MAG: DUF92 domain-containing protein [Sphaerobacter sp.]|nr:DUF92 domain-containing protein [Sphaerobacter sp.]